MNTATKQQAKALEEVEKTWEYTVKTAFGANRDNVLLEFTATADTQDKNVRAKYLDKIVMNYPLLNFRQSGYTKDFRNFATDTDLWTRALIALVMSEYRRYLFADVHQNIKPVVLMKSQKIKESEAFYTAFFEHLKNLSGEELSKLSRIRVEPLHDALAYFQEKDASLDFLAHSIQDAFTPETSIIMNGASNDNDANQILVNSLEDRSNPIRIVFAVDMLNEGWDVLNLFDIVRLYDTRQGSGTAGKVGNYTTREAQLIGRAARYCPFLVTEDQERFKRKYDSDIKNPYRLLETMYFHSRDDSRYIAELRMALIATGLQDEKTITRTYHLKDSFKMSDLYKGGLAFSNTRLAKSRRSVYGLEGSLRNKTYTYHLSGVSGKLQSLLGESASTTRNAADHYEHMMVHLREIPYNILRGASERYGELRFSVLKGKYPNLKTLREFLTSEEYLGNVMLDVSYSVQTKAKALYEACVYAMQDVAKHVTEIRQEYRGSTVFQPKPLKKILRDKSIVLSEIDANGGKGVSQNNNDNPNYQLDLRNESWYVFDDNYGTSEEKLFLRYFKAGIAPRLQAKGLEFYVVRNERIPELAIFSFDDGERFEPDFLLFIKKPGNQTFSAAQVYVEPKGTHLLLQDQWKEEFLADITLKAEVDPNYSSGNQYTIIGMPFFNEKERMTEFTKAMNQFIDKL